jgi:transcriptional regulator with XRE-family HTH domain
MLDIAKVKSLREAKGWSQQQAAEKAGMRDRQAWSRIERGATSVTLETLEKVAKALGVKARDLLK